MKKLNSLRRRADNVAKLKLNDAKELIKRNIKAGVKRIERQYNECEADEDIIRLAEEIRKLDNKNKADYARYTPVRNFK